MAREQLNIRIDTARKQRWIRAANARGLDLTAWLFLIGDEAAQKIEQEELFPLDVKIVPARGAYFNDAA